MIISFSISLLVIEKQRGFCANICNIVLHH
jgi:hypothetical protein